MRGKYGSRCVGPEGGRYQGRGPEGKKWRILGVKRVRGWVGSRKIGNREGEDSEGKEK
jgi:hypothetical protein